MHNPPTTRRERRANRRATARRLADVRRANRAASGIRRRGEASLTTHCLAAGLAPRDARTAASSIRRNAQKAGIVGREARVHAGRHMRDARRYSPAEVASAAVLYRPRRPDFKALAARLRLAA